MRKIQPLSTVVGKVFSHNIDFHLPLGWAIARFVVILIARKRFLFQENAAMRGCNAHRLPWQLDAAKLLSYLLNCYKHCWCFCVWKLASGCQQHSVFITVQSTPYPSWLYFAPPVCLIDSWSWWVGDIDDYAKFRQLRAFNLMMVQQLV